MIPHPNTMHAVSDLRRQDLLATAEREHLAANVPGPAPQWRSMALRALAFAAVLLGLRV